MKYNEKKRLQIAMRRFYSTANNSKDIALLIGIDKQGFINHINKYLVEGMTLETFGKTWGLDHIVPVEIFDFSNDEDKKLCYNYNNIMPMYNSDNRLKGASVHFSLAKLESMYTNVYIDRLKARCNEVIIRVYQKYLLP